MYSLQGGSWSSANEAGGALVLREREEDARRSAERLGHALTREPPRKAKVGDLEDRDARRVPSVEIGGRGGLQEEVLRVERASEARSRGKEGARTRTDLRLDVAVDDVLRAQEAQCIDCVVRASTRSQLCAIEARADKVRAVRDAPSWPRKHRTIVSLRPPSFGCGYRTLSDGLRAGESGRRPALDAVSEGRSPRLRM